MISLLSTTMVRWFPLPEKRKVMPSECEGDSMMHYSVQQHQSAAKYLQPSIKEMGLVHLGPSNQIEIEYLDPSNQIELAYLDPSSQIEIAYPNTSNEMETSYTYHTNQNK